MQPVNETQAMLLELLSGALFQKQVNTPFTQWRELFREATAHKVFPLVFHTAKGLMEHDELYERAQKMLRQSVSKTVMLHYAHAELNQVMQENHIDYITFKGLSSALYYPEPELRVSGDVDFYVEAQDFERCEEALRRVGFVCKAHDEKHESYVRDSLLLEIHRHINGIPSNEQGARLNECVFGNLIAGALTVEVGNGSVKIPGKFHHGMILLLHTLSHLIAEGIGLRQLCDWAVFEASMEQEEFTALFETTLKQFGLWRFAQLLSLCANRFLGAPYRAWQGEADPALLEQMIADILAAGNFGEKDEQRKRQIKYIADRGDGTVKRNSAFRQVWYSLAKRAAEDNISRAAVLVEYISNLLAGKQKPDTKKIVDAAMERKALYSEFHLFESE